MNENFFKMCVDSLYASMNNLYGPELYQISGSGFGWLPERHIFQDTHTEIAI